MDNRSGISHEYYTYWLILMNLFFFRYISGSMHYSRVPSYYWKDRLIKLRFAGLNAVQTYVPWNFHEPFPGLYNFDGDHDLVKFISIAQEVGLLVILRAGPYICGEWEMGGFPSWLLRNTSIVLRSSDPRYLTSVDKWMNTLLSRIKHLLYENGGPIITIQVENEYGSYYTCDKDYLKHLETLFRSILGPNVVLFTTDGAGDGYLKCGTIPSLYATVDFGITSSPENNFKPQRDYEPHGPLVNSEFYTGWLDHWGEPHQKRDGQQFAASLDKVLQLNASVNMYMFEGGTNFGFWNGANAGDSSYSPQPTSYDYDAPLTERGDITQKLYEIRTVIKSYIPVPSQIPPVLPVSIYGNNGVVKMTYYADLLKSSNIITRQVVNNNPLTFEEMHQNFGFIIYTTVNDIDSKVSNAILTIDELHDRASVYWNSQFVGILMRQAGNVSNLSLSFTADTNVKGPLVIVVENMGRVNFGSYIKDFKGILNGVYLNGKQISDWTTASVPLNNTEKLTFTPLTSASSPPKTTVFFKGSFTINGYPNDTYLSMDNWSKGVAFINGFNLGRYWPVKGPQKTLYVPASILKTGDNELILFEIDSAPCQTVSLDTNCFVKFVNQPDIGITNEVFTDIERR